MTTLNPQVTRAYAVLLNKTFDDGTGNRVPKYIEDETQRVHEQQQLLPNIDMYPTYQEVVQIYIANNFA